MPPSAKRSRAEASTLTVSPRDDRPRSLSSLARTVSLPAICRSSFVWDGSSIACPGVEAIIFHYMEK